MAQPPSRRERWRQFDQKLADGMAVRLPEIVQPIFKFGEELGRCCRVLHRYAGTVSDSPPQRDTS